MTYQGSFAIHTLVTQSPLSKRHPHMFKHVIYGHVILLRMYTMHLHKQTHCYCGGCSNLQHVRLNTEFGRYVSRQAFRRHYTRGFLARVKCESYCPYVRLAWCPHMRLHCNITYAQHMSQVRGYVGIDNSNLRIKHYHQGARLNPYCTTCLAMGMKGTLSDMLSRMDCIV